MKEELENRLMAKVLKGELSPGFSPLGVDCCFYRRVSCSGGEGWLLLVLRVFPHEVLDIIASFSRGEGDLRPALSFRASPFLFEREGGFVVMLAGMRFGKDSSLQALPAGVFWPVTLELHDPTRALPARDGLRRAEGYFTGAPGAFRVIQDKLLSLQDDWGDLPRDDDITGTHPLGWEDLESLCLALESWVGEDGYWKTLFFGGVKGPLLSEEDCWAFLVEAFDFPGDFIFEMVTKNEYRPEPGG